MFNIFNINNPILIYNLNKFHSVCACGTCSNKTEEKEMKQATA